MDPSFSQKFGFVTVLLYSLWQEIQLLSGLDVRRVGISHYRVALSKTIRPSVYRGTGRMGDVYITWSAVCSLRHSRNSMRYVDE